ncbi:MAG: hypothetical protein ACYTDY_06930 [Planctomycetota bacterium]|jgi:hypothetical protein
MELRQALDQISEIREQMARSSVFRGYRAVPVAATGLLAFAGAAVQSVLIPDPAADPAAWLGLWVGVAVLCVLVTGVEMLVRYARSSTAIAKARTRIALGQFVPPLAVGLVLTHVLYRLAPDALWTLPGIWALLFALGIFASRPVLPRALDGVALYYGIAGIAVLYVARGEHAFSPWAMALPFGVGQLVTAWHLYWTLERRDDARAT